MINAELKIRAAAGLEAVLEEKAVGRNGGWSDPAICIGSHRDFIDSFREF